MYKLLNSLNENQKIAATHIDGPMLILAGAGSGKTKTITSRLAYLIGEVGIDPLNTLTLTFTNKAAREMKDRVAKLLSTRVEDMWMGTFHSICVRILRRDIDKIGYRSMISFGEKNNQFIKDIHFTFYVRDKVAGTMLLSQCENN